MKLSNLGLFNEVKVLENNVYSDERGFFLEAFNEKRFNKILNSKITFVQDNHSRSKKGVLRGLHFQRTPFPQAKLVRVAKGSILDVVVDIRIYSKNFGKWESIELSERNSLMLYVPEGFAHGFLAIENDSDVIYKTNNFYHPESDRSLNWSDSNLMIDWKLNIYKIENPILSEKDHSAPSLIELKKNKSLFY
jgi:dTDP-4-dehydrorhamnose 3,5-epimerase